MLNYYENKMNYCNAVILPNYKLSKESYLIQEIQNLDLGLFIFDRSFSYAMPSQPGSVSKRAVQQYF